MNLRLLLEDHDMPTLLGQVVQMVREADLDPVLWRSYEPTLSPSCKVYNSGCVAAYVIQFEVKISDFVQKERKPMAMLRLVYLIEACSAEIRNSLPPIGLG